MSKLKQQSVGVLEHIVDEILKHDAAHPDHGTGCACHDKHAGAIRQMLKEHGMHGMDRLKSWSNLITVFHYIEQSGILPPVRSEEKENLTCGDPECTDCYPGIAEARRIKTGR